jgi:glutathione S-transferase
MAKAEVKWEHREVSLKNKPQEMIAVSSKGTVPVLVIDDRTILDESLDVMLWALHQQDPEKWLDIDMQQALQLIKENDIEFKPNLDRYKYHIQYQEQSQEHYRERGEQFLHKLNVLLENNHGAGLLCERRSLADAAIFPFIRQFAGVDQEWFENTDYNYLKNWLEEWKGHSDFLSIMQKYDFWH